MIPLNKKEKRIREIFDEYDGNVDISCLGRSYQKNKYFVVFKYPYRKYYFETPEELIRICEEAKTNGNIDYSQKATKKKI